MFLAPEYNFWQAHSKLGNGHLQKLLFVLKTENEAAIQQIIHDNLEHSLDDTAFPMATIFASALPR